MAAQQTVPQIGTANSVKVLGRHRAVMATIADAITAASVGRHLQVSVACLDAHERVFADRLARALHARGRPCQCLPPARGDAAVDTVDRDAAAVPVVAVIAGSPTSVEQAQVCRVAIRLDVAADPGRPVAGSIVDATVGGACDRVDIVVDYHDPDDPVIRRVEAVSLRGCDHR